MTGVQTCALPILCPETEDIQKIEITFAEVDMIGCPAPGYKALSYACAYWKMYGRSSNGSDGEKCPLFRSGEQQMFWPSSQTFG